MEYTEEELKMLEKAVNPNNGIVKRVLGTMKIDNRYYDDCYSTAQFMLCSAVKKYDKSRGKWKSFAWATAKNAIINELQKIKVTEGKNVRLNEDMVMIACRDELSSELRLDLENNLSTIEREAIQRTIVDGGTHEQVAQKMKISKAKLKDILSVSLAKMKNQYDDEEE